MVTAMESTMEDLWNNFQKLRQDIGVMLNDPSDKLPRNLVDARARQIPTSQAEYSALQLRPLELRAFLRIVDRVNGMDSAKTQLLNNLNDLQRQLDSAPSRKDHDAANKSIKEWEVHWASVGPEYERLKAKEQEMVNQSQDFSLKEADYARLKNMEATMKAEHNKLAALEAKEQETANQSKEFAAKDAEYKRLKEIENRLNANDAEYKDLLRNSNEVKSNTEELARLRSLSNKMREEAAELGELRCKNNQV